MKPFCFFLAIALMTTSCLKSLDYDLNDNPFDTDYEGGFILVDEYAHESINGSNGDGCDPIMRFHLDAEAMERMQKIDLDYYYADIKLNVYLKRTSIQSGNVQTKLVSRAKLEDYILDSIYTSSNQDWQSHNPDDMICPEAIITYRCASCPATDFYKEQLKTQVLECFRCGG